MKIEGADCQIKKLPLIKQTAINKLIMEDRKKNRQYISKAIFVLFCLFVYFIPMFAYASDLSRVLILPFKIHSDKEYKYLETKIPRLISTDFKDNQVDIVRIPDAVAKKEGLNDKTDYNSMASEKIRQIGLSADADYVVWGSASFIGERISLDVSMIETVGDKYQLVQFAEGKGLENLSTTVTKLSQSLLRKIYKKEIISKVVVMGSSRIEEDAILKKIKTKKNDIFSAKKLSNDLKTVYSMGYFDDVSVNTEDGPGGKIVIFNVKEKPTVRRITIEGNRIYDTDEILAVLNISAGSILNIYKLNENVEQIRHLYIEKNYHNNKITYKIDKIDTNQADIVFIIKEGEKVMVKEITFEGNSAYSSSDLRGLMETKEKWFLSWLTGAGEFDKEVLSQDVARISAFYHNNGYIQARVGDPVVKYKGDFIYISIKINEGKQFIVGDVNVTGDLEFTKQELFHVIKIKKGIVYNRQTVQKDISSLTDLYADLGYANTKIDPIINKNKETLEVDITYNINKKGLVYIERIVISGNTKTRDKVIRRQLDVYEAELYSNSKIKRGVRNLNRLDYFESVTFDTIPGSSEDQKILDIEVVEKPTGAFSFGGGYSSEDSLFAMVSVTQRNLFGRGQILNLRAELGGKSSMYKLSFTEPWLFDIPLSAGFDIYKWKREYNYYDKKSTGGALRGSYPVFDYTRLYLTYSLDDSHYSNVREGYVYYLPDGLTSAVTTKLRYDSKDKTFITSSGVDTSLMVEYAGGVVGGDIGFVKSIADAGWYIPLFWNTVGFLHAKGGIIGENGKGEIPDPERYYLGGINSVRGYKYQDIHIVNSEGLEIGGNKFVQFNFEFIFPLLKEYGVMGVTFYDMGNVYNKSDNVQLGDLYTSCGGGIRWSSPMGPLRIEYGYILNGHEYETGSGRWEFAMGTSF